MQGCGASAGVFFNICSDAQYIVFEIFSQLLICIKSRKKKRKKKSEVSLCRPQVK